MLDLILHWQTVTVRAKSEGSETWSPKEQAGHCLRWLDEQIYDGQATMTTKYSCSCSLGRKELQVYKQQEMTYPTTQCENIRKAP